MDFNFFKIKDGKGSCSECIRNWDCTEENIKCLLCTQHFEETSQKGSIRDLVYRLYKHGIIDKDCKIPRGVLDAGVDAKKQYPGSFPDLEEEND